MQKLAIILGRVFLSLLFIISSIYKMFDWKGMEKAFVRALCDWHSHSAGAQKLQECFSEMLPWIPAILILAVTFEFLGGLSILFNFWPRLGAFVLLVFLLPTTVIFHQFWFLDGANRDLQFVLFLKNLAIMGGLLYVIAFGGSSSSKKRIDSMDLPEIDKD